MADERLGRKYATVCRHCNLRAFVEGRAPMVFDESPQEHARLYHADFAAMKREQAELERQAAIKLGFLDDAG